MASPFFSPFRRPPMNPFGSMMGFGMGPNLFSGGMPFYNPFPRMPMYGGGLGGFGGFGGMGGGFNPFIMTPPPMQRFPRYDSLIPMQSQMPSMMGITMDPIRDPITAVPDPIKAVDDYGLDFYKNQPVGEGLKTTLPLDIDPKSLTKTPVYTVEEINQNFRDIMNTDPASIQSKEDLDRLGAGPLFARQRSDIFNKFAPGLIPQTKRPEMDNRPKKFDPNVDRLSPGTDLSTAVDDRGVPIFGGRDTPGANSTAFERKNDPESLRLQGGPKYTTMPVGPGVPFDPSGLQARISDLEGRQMFDPSGLKSRIDALENRQMPTFTPFDPSGLQSRLDALENRQMPSYTPFDPSSLQSQIDALQNRQTPMFNPSGLQARLNTLEDRIQKTGNLNMTDIEALIEQRLSDSLRNMNLSPRNPGVNSITYDPNVSIPFKEEDLRKRYNNRLFIGQGGPYDI